MCDFYDIQRPMAEIMAKVRAAPMSIEKVVMVTEMSRIPGKQQHFLPLAAEALNYARVKLIAWPEMLDFVLANAEARKDVVFSLLQDLGGINAFGAKNEAPFTFRFKATNVNGEDATSVYFFGSNLKWFFQFHKSNFEASFGCHSHESGNKVTADVSVAVYQPSQNWARRDLYNTRRVVFDNEWNVSLAQPLLTKNFMQSNGFVKDNCVFLEVTVKLVEVEDIPDYMGISEVSLHPKKK
eukprot:TRINITY_DN4951_c0_g1_i6.p1 TRINITY_DN4951_c0_g1~~TRINITY_DN4951_c0_g1_i6.p1  ORF type:complete len:239 (-),score=72.05 TRINITY_DN4951_c0_g1_i6:306-1022(-)